MAVLVQQSNIRALGMLCRYRRVLLEHSEGCGGTEEYYRRTGEAVLVQKSTIGEPGTVLVQQSTIGTLWTLCWYNRALQEPWGGCAGTTEYYGALWRLCWYSRIL